MIRTNIFHKLQIFLQTILILILICPLVTFAFIPIYIFRFIVSKWSQFFIESHGKIVPPLSTLFALDDLTGEPASTILLTLSLKGQLEAKQVVQKLQIILDSGCYPELQQSLTTWMGFYFWKWDPEFALENHITLIHDPICGEDIQKLKLSLLKKSYLLNRPLWEILIVKNFVSDSKVNSMTKSICFIRFHHGLTDGLSLYKLVQQLSDRKDWTQAKPNVSNASLPKTIMFSLKLFFYGPFQLISTIIQSQDKNEWKMSHSKLSKYTGQYITESQKVSLIDIKLIANSQSVTTSAVILTLLTGSIRRMMVKYNKSELPDYINILTAWPMQHHPNHGLTNYTTVSPVKVPLWTPDPLQRLKIVNSELSRIRHSTLPYGFYWMSFLLGSIFPCLIKRINIGSVGTIVMSNFPGPESSIEICGHEADNLEVNVGLPHHKEFSMDFVSVGFNGKLVIANGSDKRLFPFENIAQELLGFVIQEVDVLKRTPLNDFQNDV